VQGGKSATSRSKLLREFSRFDEGEGRRKVAEEKVAKN